MATWCQRIKSRALEAAPGKHESTQPNLLLRRANRTLYAAQCLAAEANFAMPATSPTTWLKGTQVLNARTLLLNARDCERQTTVHPEASPEDYHTLRFPI